MEIYAQTDCHRQIDKCTPAAPFIINVTTISRRNILMLPSRWQEKKIQATGHLMLMKSGQKRGEL